MKSEEVPLVEGHVPFTAKHRSNRCRFVLVVSGALLVIGIFIAVLVFVLNAPARPPPPESDLVSHSTLQGIQRMVSLTMAQNNTALFDRIAWLCDTYGPRFSGSQALEDAIDGLHDKFVHEDLMEVLEEHVTVPKWVRGKEYATMLQPRVKQLSMMGLGQSNSTYKADGTRGPIQGEVIPVASWNDMQRKRAEVVGKIVLFNIPWVAYGFNNQYRRDCATQAGALGAIGVLLRSVTPFSMQSPHTGSSVTATIAAAAISVEDALQIQRMVDRGQKVVVEMEVNMDYMGESLSRNLIVSYPGAKYPDEYVILGGHIDSWDLAEGAMDDAGGALLGWEAIRLMKEAKLQPDRTILNVMFTNEENGLRGATQFALNRQNESSKISLALESDSGPFLIYGLSVNGLTEAIDILQAAGAIAFDVNDKGRRLPGGRVTPTQGLAPDLGPLSQLGVTTGIVTPIDVLASADGPCEDLLKNTGAPYTEDAVHYPGYFWYHHTRADTVDKLSPRDLQLSAASLAVWAYTTANLPMLLPQRPPP